MFEFATAGRIFFGAGCLAEVMPLMAGIGRRALLVSGRSLNRADQCESKLNQSQVKTARYAVSGEPTVNDIEEGVRQLVREQCDFVIGFGGGSALDAAKAIAALAANPAPLSNYLEVIGLGKPLAQRSLPCVAIPTTAGTGAEVTRNAVLSSPTHRVKVSMRSPHMLPCLAVVDPDLTLMLPPAVTASTGLDALTQLIEPYVSLRANPLTDGFCLEGIQRVAHSLRRAYHHGADLTARTDMSLAGLLGGLALANAGLGAVHGFAGPMGGMFEVPHGTVCATLLPHVMAANLFALRQRQRDSHVLPRFTTIARLLTGNPAAEPEAAITWIADVCRELQIPSLSQMGLALTDLPALVEKASRASSMKSNPIVLSPDELRGILEQAW
jgi:alcohol dehydrogenase class IV